MTRWAAKTDDHLQKRPDRERKLASDHSRTTLTAHATWAAEIQVRTGQAPPALTREAFGERFRVQFYDPRFDDERDAIRRLEEIAWRNYQDGRKAPRTVEAGPGFANPDMRISVEWKATRDRLIAAEKTQKDPGTPSRVLIVCGSPRNDGSCPGEVSKTWRLANVARDTAVARDVEVDLLDLSLLTSGYRYHIHPCKGCVSTAQPLCHWPCSCYPNHDLGQADDWMNEIYERWTLAHGVILVLPVHWYMATSPVKLMMDRLVCADGGNPDPTSTRGKNAQLAKSIEMQGWGYPKHLAGRVYGIVVHGDVAGIEDTRRALSDWLDWMGLIDAGPMARLDRFIGYYEPYATSHEALDRDEGVQRETCNVALAVTNAVAMMRKGTLSKPDAGLSPPRPK